MKATEEYRFKQLDRRNYQELRKRVKQAVKLCADLSAHGGKSAGIAIEFIHDGCVECGLPKEIIESIHRWSKGRRRPKPEKKCDCDQCQIYGEHSIPMDDPSEI